MTQSTENTLSVVRADLADAVHQAIGGTRNRAVQIIDAIIEGMVSELLTKQSLSVARFGVFAVQQKAARLGRNPKTGETVQIPARQSVAFRPAQALKTALND